MGMGSRLMDSSGALLLEPPESMTFADFVSKYDILDVTDRAVVVSDREGPAIQLKETPQMGELGSSMPTRYSFVDREDYNPELRGREGLMRYDKMRRNDGQVRMSLRHLKTPVLAGRWYMEPYDESKRSKTIADFIWHNFMDGMTASWPQFLLESLNMLDFGFYMFEKVRAIKDGKVVFQKLAPKHPLDLYEWEYDEHGGPKVAHFYAPKNLANSVAIPIDKLLVFTFDKEGGDMTGISALRPAYKHHFFKDTLYRIDAIQKERHGIGIPIIKLPPGFSPKDKEIANSIGANLRTNERTHVVLPPMWELAFVKLEGQPVDAMVSIEHHDKMIARNVMLSTQGDSKDDDKLFLKNARFVAELFRDVMNKWAIPELVRWNWGIQNYPQLRVRRIGDTIDWRAMSFAIRNFVGAGILEPDDKLEEFIRDEMDLPKKDEATVREQTAKQMPGQSAAPFNQNGKGKPKQSTAPNMAINAGSSKVGRDGGSPKA